MPTKRTRRARNWQPELSGYQLFELLMGEVVYPLDTAPYDGYGDRVGKDLRAFIGDAMRHDWAAHRDHLLELWVSGASSADMPGSKPWAFWYGRAGTRPWAWWELEDHPEMGEDETEAEYFTRCGLWLPGERTALGLHDENARLRTPQAARSRTRRVLIGRAGPFPRRSRPG